MNYIKILNLIKANERLDGNLCAEINGYTKEISCEDCIIAKMKRKYELINICHGSKIRKKDLNSYYNVREAKLAKLLEK